MSPFSAVVMYASIWFLVVFVVLPGMTRSQAEAGEVAPGTPPGAPAHFPLRRMMLRVTAITTIVWIALAGTIVFSGLTIRDIDFFNRLHSPSR